MGFDIAAKENSDFVLQLIESGAVIAGRSKTTCSVA